MRCNTFDTTSFLNGIAWLEKNRITFSEITDYGMEGYRAPTYSIKYVLEGTEEYRVRDRKFSVNKGQFLIANRDRPLDFSVRSEIKVAGLCIHLEESFLREAYTSLYGKEKALLDDPLCLLSLPPWEEALYSDRESGLGLLLRQLKQRLDRDTATIDVEEKETYQQLAFHFLALQRKGVPIVPDREAFRGGNGRELVKRLELARTLIATNEQQLEMGTVAREAALSVSHFFRSFKKCYGITPHQYHQQCRMERATRLLREKRSATEVAFECGFTDLASFSKSFKKHFSYSPRRYGK